MALFLGSGIPVPGTTACVSSAQGGIGNGKPGLKGKPWKRSRSRKVRRIC